MDKETTDTEDTHNLNSNIKVGVEGDLTIITLYNEGNGSVKHYSERVSAKSMKLGAFNNSTYKSDIVDRLLRANGVDKKHNIDVGQTQCVNCKYN